MQALKWAKGQFELSNVCNVHIFKEARWTVQLGLIGIAGVLWGRGRGFLQPPCVPPLQQGGHPLVVEGNNSLSRTALAACASLSVGLNIFTWSTAFNEVIMISNFRFFLVKVQAEKDLYPLLPKQ